VKADSQSLFRKQFSNSQGYIDYKFVAASTQVISREAFLAAETHRNELYLQKQHTFPALLKENKELEGCMAEKDRMIEHLTDKINGLLDQNISLNKKISEDMHLMRSMNISVNILGGKRAGGPQRQFGQTQRDEERRREELEEMRDRLNEVTL
jgi:hypothetical protein